MIPAPEHPPNQPAPADGPDWSQITDEIHCPMCEYNLRGLVTPRCPECGYRFTWKELLDSGLRRHPFLYEQQDRPGIRSFLLTAVSGLRPRRFWQTVLPQQRSRLWHLFGYWLRGAVLLLIVAATSANIIIAAIATQVLSRGLATRRGVSGSSVGEFVLQTWMDGTAIFLTLMLSLPPLILPWLVFSTLMIFQITMRRKRVRVHHVLRAVVYAHDPTFHISFVLLFCAFVVANVYTRLLFGIDEVFLVGIAIAAGLALIYRLFVAMATYLRFDRPLATVLSAYVILSLLVLNIVVLIVNLRH